MKCRFSVLAFLIIFIVGGCSSVVKKTEVILIDDYCNDRLEVSIAEFMNKDGSLGVQAGIKNISDDRVSFQYRFQWYTETGRFIDSPTASWIPITLDPNDSYDALGAQVTPETVRTKLSIKKNY